MIIHREREIDRERDLERKRDMKRDRDSQDRDHGAIGGLGSGVGVVIRLIKGVCG